MVNYNMGQYYAWSNLSKYIKAAYRRHFYTPKYEFKYIQPKVQVGLKLTPFQNLKANRIYRESEDKYTLLAIGFISFLFAKFIYQVLHDQDIGYYYHINFPIVSQSIVWINADIVEFTNPFFDIVPKNRYEITQVYPRLFELIFNTKGRIEQNDKKALQLRQAIREYDRRESK